MPVCYITLSDKVPNLSKQQLMQIRQCVAEGLDSQSRKLDDTHIAIRLQRSKRECMLGDIEIDIFSQLYLRRLFSRDKRASIISQKVSNYLNCCCATWINMGCVGYSRVSKGGSVYFSDSDNIIVRWIQKARGISTKERTYTRICKRNGDSNKKNLL